MEPETKNIQKENKKKGKKVEEKYGNKCISVDGDECKNQSEKKKYINGKCVIPPYRLENSNDPEYPKPTRVMTTKMREIIGEEEFHNCYEKYVIGKYKLDTGSPPPDNFVPIIMKNNTNKPIEDFPSDWIFSSKQKKVVKRVTKKNIKVLEEKPVSKEKESVKEPSVEKKELEKNIDKQENEPKQPETNIDKEEKKIMTIKVKRKTQKNVKAVEEKYGFKCVGTNSEKCEGQGERTSNINGECVLPAFRLDFSNDPKYPKPTRIMTTKMREIIGEEEFHNCYEKYVIGKYVKDTGSPPPDDFVPIIMKNISKKSNDEFPSDWIFYENPNLKNAEKKPRKTLKNKKIIIREEQKPAEEPSPGPTGEPAPGPTEEPAPGPTEEPAPGPTEEPAPGPSEEPALGPTEEPAPGPAEEPAPGPAEEPVQKGLPKPIVNKKTETDIDTENLLYPSLDDTNFNVKIAKRKEFNSTKYDGTIYDIKSQSEKLCNAEFSLLPHQLFIKNFLSFQTPYNSLLLYHGLGTGKTCSAIGVAEETRAYMKQLGFRKSIIVIASPNVQDNFRLQLFDERKLKQENGIWNLNSCVGPSLLNEINPTEMKNITREKVISQINTLINQYYVFLGYTQFANYVNESIEVLGVSYKKEEKERIRIQKIKNIFNNRLIIVDEVHNMKIIGESGKNVRPADLLTELAEYSDNLRLLLLSATPMYNSYKEIIWIVNLLNLNDKRTKIKVSDVFDEKTGTFKEPGGRELLVRKLTGYVSYIRGENPFTFPYRIYPEVDIKKTPTIQMNGKTINPETFIKYVKIYPVDITDYQKKAYQFIIDTLKQGGTFYNKKGKEYVLPDFGELDSLGYTLLKQPLESLTIVYPSDKIDNSGSTDIKSKKDIINQITGEDGLSRVMNYETLNGNKEEKIIPQRIRYEYKKSIQTKYGRIFSREELYKYSAKMARICDIIRESEGIVLIFSEFIDGGVVPMALSLEEMGFTRYGYEKQTKSLFKKPPTEPIDAITMKPKGNGEETFQPAKYVMITGNKYFSPNNDEDLKYLNSYENRNGENVKVVIISLAAAEGVDFKNIRQIHILDPWYNMNRIDQIIGRGVRNLSHCSLPFEKRNVEIYLHTAFLGGEEETADMYLYRLAEQKAIRIGIVSRVLKETAVDCILNIGQTNFTTEKLLENVENRNIKLKLPSGKMIDFVVGDKKYTDLCDYMDKCDFTCKPNAEKITEKDLISVTYNNDFIQTNQAQIVKRIRDLFIDIPGQSRGKVFFEREELINSVNINKQYPIEQIYSALTYLIKNKNEYIVDRYGRLGNLVNRGNYYLFQPLEITDENVGIYERTVPVDVKLSSVLIPLPKETDFTSKTQNVEQEKIIHEESKQDYDNLIKGIKENIEKVFNTERNDKLIVKDWFITLGLILHHLSEVYEIDRETIEKIALEHILDEMFLQDKLCLLGKLFSSFTPKDDIERKIKSYFNDKIVTSSNGTIGIVLSDDNKTTDIYVQSPNKNEWVISEFSSKKDIISSPQYSEKYIFNKKFLNNIIGFTSKEKKKYVFKTRDLKGSVNKKGAIVANAESADILRELNNIVVDPDEPAYYTKENLETYIGKGKIRAVVLLEVILRAYQLTSEDVIWYLTNEKMVVNKIYEFVRK